MFPWNVPAGTFYANVLWMFVRKVLSILLLNVPQEHSENIALNRSKNPDIFLALETFMECSGKVLCYGGENWKAQHASVQFSKINVQTPQRNLNSMTVQFYHFLPAISATSSWKVKGKLSQYYSKCRKYDDSNHDFTEVKILNPIYLQIWEKPSAWIIGNYLIGWTQLELIEKSTGDNY